MSKIVQKNLTWEYGYMLGMTAIGCILAFLLNKIIMPAILIMFLGDLAGIIVLWRKPLSRKLLSLIHI